MEITWKGLLAVVIPACITLGANTIDNSIKWRSEMEQKNHTRQMQIVDRILDIPSAKQRLAVAEFYLSCGVLAGQFRSEIELAIASTRRLQEQQAEEERLAEERWRTEQEEIRRMTEQRSTAPPSSTGWEEPILRGSPSPVIESPSYTPPPSPPVPSPSEQTTIFMQDY